jgi:hypothetical protein
LITILLFTPPINVLEAFSQELPNMASAKERHVTNKQTKDSRNLPVVKGVRIDVER